MVIKDAKNTGCDTSLRFVSVRSAFPFLKKYNYLNAASDCPMSTYAAEAGKHFFDEMLCGQSVLTWWQHDFATVETNRDLLARFLNADREEVAFMTNSTEALNIPALFFKGQGGRVLTLKDEFPSSVYVFQHHGYPVDLVESLEDGTIPIESIERAIRPDTKILMVSHVQYSTGFRIDLEALSALCQKHGLIFIVDVAQSLGAFKIDVKKIPMDFLVFSGHKWLMSGYGSGGIYIQKKHLLPERFPFIGWHSVKDPFAFDHQTMALRKEASVLEVGCPPFANIFALGANLKFLMEIGLDAIQERVIFLTDFLQKKLDQHQIPIASTRDPQHRSGITMIPAPNPKELMQALLKEKIVVSVRGKGLRVSPHLYNLESDIEQFVEALVRLFPR